MRMDLVFTVILIALVAWHVMIAVAFIGWSTIETFKHARGLLLRLKPVPPTQPTLDLREARI